MKVLITGAAGFVGGHMVECASRHEATVYALARRFRELPSQFKHQVEGLHCNLDESEATVEVLRQTSPDATIHLAAMAPVAASFHSPRDCLVANVSSSMNLFEASSRLGFSGPLVNVRSGDEYGMVSPDEIPIRESTPLRPVTPYAVGKAAQDLRICELIGEYHRGRKP